RAGLFRKARPGPELGQPLFAGLLRPHDPQPRLAHRRYAVQYPRRQPAPRGSRQPLLLDREMTVLDREMTASRPMPDAPASRPAYPAYAATRRAPAPPPALFRRPDKPQADPAAPIPPRQTHRRFPVGRISHR